MNLKGTFLITICRLLLSLTFIMSGFVKAVDPLGTQYKLIDYAEAAGLARYANGYLTLAMAVAMAVFEFWLGICLLFTIRRRRTVRLMLLVMAVFTPLTLWLALTDPIQDCGCFGEALKLSPWQTFFKNLILLPLAVVVWWRYRPDRIFAFKPLEIVLTVLFFLFSMGLGYYCYIHLPLIDFLPYKVGVNIREAMQEPAETVGKTETVLIYRDRETGRERSFSLDETEWQDTLRWEWVDTRMLTDAPTIRPLVSEFALRDNGSDATDDVLAVRGRLYMLCVTSFDRLPERCIRRMAALVARAAEEGAQVVCLTPYPLDGETWYDFGTGEVHCYNIDASTMRTMLRARNGVVVLDDGTITAKMNCRDIRP